MCGVEVDVGEGGVVGLEGMMWDIGVGVGWVMGSVLWGWGGGGWGRFGGWFRG